MPTPKTAGPQSTVADNGNVLAAPTQKSFQGIQLTIPAGWEERTPANEFIQAEYRLTPPEGNIRITMSSAGGGKEANVERWRGQFTRGADDPEAKEETIVIDGQEAIVVELFGTFRDGFGGGGEQRNWCMFGAVIPTGPANFFVKMTGPREAVIAQREAFRDLVTTAKLGN
ncbi:MAG TPA: hypothetical protein VFG20_17955 [Planctomycetaceae bacterium]|jgi:hypothetical protein|nr:hypothetical protein [Planctomycetaceae bacterium]